MTWISNDAVARLRDAIDLPDLSGTKYRLPRLLARGGMGSVYLVEDTTLSRTVALKAVDVSDSSEAAADRLRKEAQIISQLEHPGIVPVHDVGLLPDGRMYYTMKYVQGERLDDFAHQNHTVSERLRIFQKICEAVAFAHARRVLHRDLKPENIMVGSFGEVLVMDWGIAKIVGPNADQENDSGNAITPGDNAQKTLHGAIVGTPAYMSPEQARGEAIDERTDIFGLGAVLYSLLTQQPPMIAATITGIRKKTHESVQRPRLLNRKISKSLDAICMRALAPEPGNRYSDVASLAADITRFLDDQSVSAYRENTLERIDRWVAHNRFLVVLVLAYLLMRVLLLITSGR
ncbi:MAG: serine/threonine-protein kinase [Bacteroidota bacterium]